jgi:serine/threonine-protein kinase HipA
MIPSIQECEVYWHGHLPRNKSHRVKVGTLVRNQEHLYFGYDSRWISRGIEISPGFLPLSLGTKPVSLTDPRSAAYIEDTNLRRELRGLPGPFYDSLPDRWGMRLLANHTGTDPETLDALEILCHLGNRCMGAFSYEPAVPTGIHEESLNSATLDLYCRQAARLNSGHDPETLEKAILDALEDSGGSAGGMRPKILLAIQKEKDPGNESASTPVLRKLAGYDHEDMPSDYQPWLLKFDTEPEQCRGLLESACAAMAREAGVVMPETRLIRTKSPDGTRHAHFAVLRFDRQLMGDKWQRVHMHTAAGMLLRNYNDLDLDYTDLLQLTRSLTGDDQQVRQVYFRAVFNVLAGNSDDHAKNHAFLLDSSGKWRISPAYDLTPSRLRLQPGMRSTSVLGNKSEKIPLSTLKELADEHGIEDPMSIIQQVAEAVRKWGDFAKTAGIPKKIADRYGNRMKDIRPVELR